MWAALRLLRATRVFLVIFLSYMWQVAWARLWPKRCDTKERWKKINRARSRTRARGEHAFRVIKQLWGFAKVRYRGLAKNLARAQTMFALANLYQLRRELLPARSRCGL